MDFLIKNKILFWIIGILIVLNLVTIGTLWFWKFKGPHPPRVQMEKPRKDGKMFLTEELNLSKQQADEFAKLRDEHFKETKKIQDEIRNLKDELFSQFATNDSNKVAEITGKIGTKQAEVEISIFKHFQKLRNICDDTQKGTFDLLIKDILKRAGPHPGMNPGMHPGMHPGMNPGMHPGQQPAPELTPPPEQQ